VGINTPVRLYELLDVASDASPEVLQMVKNWEEVFALYEKRAFSAARDIFQSIYQKNDEDRAALKYLNRCIKYVASAPDDETWDDGIDSLIEK